MSVTTAAIVDYFRVKLGLASQGRSPGEGYLLIPLGDIAEIVTVQQREICPLPGVPKGVIGVLNLRGQLLWVMDLGQVKADYLPEARPNPQAKATVVLLQSSQGQVGCVVLSLLGITTINPADLQRLTTVWQQEYAFCSHQCDQGDGVMSLLLDTTQLFAYLQNPAGF
jgi:chemotaxis signal transduction protein